MLSMRVTRRLRSPFPEPTVTHTPASSGETVSVTVPLTGVSVLHQLHSLVRQLFFRVSVFC